MVCDRWLRGNGCLDQFDAIAEGIMGECAASAVKTFGALAFATGVMQRANERVEVRRHEGGMRLARGTEARFDAEVHSQRARFEPATAAFGQSLGFRHFWDAKHPGVERPRLRLAFRRHRKLHVIDRIY